MSHLPQSLWVNFIILRVDLTQSYVYEHYMLWVDLTRLCVISILLYILSYKNLNKLLSILVYFYVIHNSVQMTMNFIIWFCHAQLCMNDSFIIICFFHAQLCTNYYFIHNFFPMRFCKMGIFHVSLLLSLG